MAPFRRLAIMITSLQNIIIPSAAHDLSPKAAPPEQGLNLIDQMQQAPLQQSEVFTHAFKVIQSLQTAPTCNRLATATLIDSCRTLEQSDEHRQHGHSIALDQVKSTFAARLAVCELMGAHATIPPQCQVMAPNERRSADEGGFKCRFPGSRCDAKSNADGRSGNYYSKLSKRQSEQCLTALESKPQWWTSYSNARQNAISICHASRMEAEKDDLLEMHRSMTGVSADISQAFDDAIKRSSAQANEQRIFAEAVKEMQTQVFKDLDIAQANAHSRLGDFVKTFEDRLLRLLGLTTKSMQQAADDANELGDTIRESSQDAEAMRSKFQAMMTDLSEQSQHLSAAQRQELQTHQEAALAARNSLATARDSEISQVAAAFASLQHELRASTQLISLMATHQSSHNTWLQRLDSAFANLQETALTLGQMQQIHAENQTRLFEDLSLRVEETESAFGAMVSKMGTLATLIDEKTALVGGLGFFGGLGMMVVRCFLVVLVVNMMARVFMFTSTVTDNTGLVLVLWLMFMESGVTLKGLLTPFITIRNAMPSLSSLLRFWPAAVPGIALGVGVLVLYCHRRRAENERISNERVRRYRYDINPLWEEFIDEIENGPHRM